VNSYDKDGPMKALDSSMIQDIKKGAIAGESMVQNSNPHSPVQQRKLSLVNPHRNNMKTLSTIITE